MAKQKRIERVQRQGRVSAEEAARLNKIRELAKKDFPPAAGPKLPKTGLAAQIRQAREARGLTWYAVARQAGIPNPGTVRDIEYGKDAKLSNLEAVAKVVGLRLELVEEPV